MTDSLTARIDKALAITRAATPGPWLPGCAAIRNQRKEDAAAIALWRATAEQALEVAKMAKPLLDETNPFIVSDPSRKRVDMHKALVALNEALAEALP